MGRASLGAPVPRSRVVAGLVAGVLLLAAGVTWFVVAHHDDARSVTEPSAERAVDGFARAYSRHDSDDVRSRTCPDTRSVVLVSVDDNRRRVSSLHRVGAVRHPAAGRRVVTGGESGGTQARAFASAQLAGPAPGSASPAASSSPSSPSSPSGGESDVVAAILVRQNADGGWCVLALGGEVRAYTG